MFDTYKVFSKTGCPYCTKVIQVLQLAELPFIEYKLGRDFTRAEFYEEFGVGSTFPRVKFGLILNSSLPLKAINLTTSRSQLTPVDHNFNSSDFDYYVVELDHYAQLFQRFSTSTGIEYVGSWSW